MKRRWLLTIWAGVVIAAMGACASPPKPFVYHDDRDEKPGPGLFSGEAGGFVIYGKRINEKKEGDDAAKECRFPAASRGESAP